MVQISGITNKVPNYKSLQEKSLIATKFFVAINFKMLQSIAIKKNLLPIVAIKSVALLQQKFRCNKVAQLRINVFIY